MRRLLVTTFLSLDGVMQSPGGPGEDDENFVYGGWSVPHWDDTMSKVMGDIMGKPFDLLLGRKTYEIFKAYWPNAPEEAGSKPLNDATKYVVSRGTPSLDWGPAVLIRDDAADAVAKLKGGDGPELQVHGSGELIQTLLANGLVDEFHLWLFPVLIGPGKRLFSDGTVPAGLTLLDTTVSTTGVVIGTYAPAGDLKVGSF